MNRLRHLLAVLAVVAGSACQQPPDVSLVRALDQAASWAAAVAYVVELEGQRLVPAAYADVVVDDGVKEVQTIRSTIAKLTDVPVDRQTQALGACDRLLAMLTASRKEPRAIDVGQMKQLQADLRSLAGKAAGQ